MNYFVVILLCIASVAGSCPWDDATLKPWSAASSWPGSKLPLANKDVVIGAGMNILLDTITRPAKSIRIEHGGRLVWGNKDGLQLIGDKVSVSTQGELWIGNDECPFTRTATIVLGGEAHSKIAEFKQIIVLFAGGSLELHDGSPRPAFNTVHKRADNYTSGETSIPSNFNVSEQLVPSWGTGAIAGPSTEPVGAFRLICNPSHEAYGAPLEMPDQSGASQLYSYFGNTLADTSSTYQSLRTKGNSTCMSPINRSAYWMPSMLDGKGNVMRPDYIATYYKRRPSNDTECQRQGTACINFPRGIKFLYGFDMVNGTPTTGGGYFNCQGTNATSGHYPTLVAASKFCPPGSLIGAAITTPDCWDGKRLDSPNHRDHVSYGSYGSWGYYKCPDTHPWVIPAFTMAAWFNDTNLTFNYASYDNTTAGYSSWYLSSDVTYSAVAKRKLTPGTTMFSGFFGAWDDSAKNAWEGNCIEKRLTCNGGDLGNGLQLRMFDGFTMGATPEHPRIIPIPPMPSTSSTTSATSSPSSTTSRPATSTTTGASTPSTPSPSSSTSSSPSPSAASSLLCGAAFVVAAISALAMLL